MSGLLVVVFLAGAVALLLIGGLLAASDAALGVRSRAELLSLADESSPRVGSAIAAIADDEAAHVNAISFARVVAETLSAVFITMVLAYSVEQLWLALLLAAFIVTAITFVLVGSSPRTVGTHHPEAVIRFSARFVRFVRLSLGPIAGALMRFGDRVTPGRTSGGVSIRDEQQLLSMVDQATEQELLEEDDRDYIHSLMEFGNTLVREVMLPRIDMVTIDTDQSVRETLEVMLSSRHSRVPVVSAGDSDEVEGVVYLRDASGFVLRRAEEAENAAVTRIMKPAIFVPELQRADELLRQMQRESNHLALVVDEYGGISGLVTLEDLIEELLGDISDEHDRDAPETILQVDGSFQISARLPVDRLGEIFGIELEDDEVDSVGGLVAKHLGKLAESGDAVVVSGIELTALETERKRQRLVTVGARWVGADTGEFPKIDDITERN